LKWPLLLNNLYINSSGHATYLGDYAFFPTTDPKDTHISICKRIIKIFLKVITRNVNLMQQGNFINVFLARHVSGAYVHHQEPWILSCSVWFSAPSFWMGSGLESRCVSRVYCAENHMLQLNV